MNWAHQIGRRNFLGIGLAGGLSVHAMNQLFGSIPDTGDHPGPAKNVLVILEQGGMSHIDTWDPKPDAYADHRSPYRPINTNVPGIQFTELLTRTSRVADKLTIVRSMHHRNGIASGHPKGTQYALSGHVPDGPVEMPDIGSVVGHRLGSECSYLPAYIMTPGNHEQARNTKRGFLPPGTEVFKTGGKDLSDPNWKVSGLGLNEAIGTDRFQTRLQLLDNLDVGFPVQSSSDAASWQASIEQARESLLHPKADSAFAINEESEAIREEYGHGHRGQCYLLGRRLIEQGVRYVTIDVREPMTSKTPGGTNLNWDHHDFIYSTGTCNLPGAGGGGRGRYGIGTWWMMGSVDRAYSALIRDMDDRGLLDNTLICFVTEFGRTPKLNKYQGRDHWTGAYSIVLAGAGVPGGQVIGATDKQGGHVIEDAYTPDDYAATIYHKLGMNLDYPLRTLDDRPIFLSAEGRPIRGV